MKDIPSGVVRLSELAAENGITRLCMRRRFQRLDKRIRANSPNGPFVLIQNGPGSAFFVDLSVLYLHARGYIAKRLNKEPLAEMRDLLLEMRDTQLEQSQKLVCVLQDTAAIRMAV